MESHHFGDHHSVDRDFECPVFFQGNYKRLCLDHHNIILPSYRHTFTISASNTDFYKTQSSSHASNQVPSEAASSHPSSITPLSISSSSSSSSSEHRDGAIAPASSSSDITSTSKSRPLPTSPIIGGLQVSNINCENLG